MGRRERRTERRIERRIQWTHGREHRAGGGKATRVIAGFGIALVIAMLAGCSGSGEGPAAVLPDDGPLPTRSPEAAVRLLNKATTAGQAAAQTGRLELVVTEEEVNSILSARTLLGDQSGVLSAEGLDAFLERAELEGQDVAQLRDLLDLQDQIPGENGRRLRLRPRIEEPVVYFRGTGQLIVRGEVSWLFLRLPVRAVAAPRAEDGELELDFVEGQVGAVGMPELVFDLLGRGVSEAVLLGQAHARITEISVGAGMLIVRGRYEP